MRQQHTGAAPSRAHQVVLHALGVAHRVRIVNETEGLLLDDGRRFEPLGYLLGGDQLDAAARAPHRRVEVHNGLSHAQTELHAAVAQKLERVFVVVDVLCQAECAVGGVQW